MITAGHCFRDADGVRVEHPVADLTTATVGRTDLTGSAGHEVKVVAVVSNGPSCPHTAVESSARTDDIATWIRRGIRAGRGA